MKALNTLKSLSLLSVIAFVGACSDGSDDRDAIPIPGATFDAQVRWTEYGIPHVKADDYGSLGYGFGYAYALENFCTVMREFVFAAGESARYWGDDGDLDSDLVMKLFNDDARIERMIAEDLEDYTVDTLRGYAAGINRYLRETGVDNLAEGEEGCRGADWVREVDLMDTVRLIHRTVQRGSGSRGELVRAMVAAVPPESVAMSPLPPAELQAMFAARMDAGTFMDGVPEMDFSELGSNAYAVGRDGAQGSSGVLFGNPHFPWQGQERFFMFHLTLPGEYDVMGAALGGLPAPVIGFTANLAWSHTVSTGTRFNFYELPVNPDNPLEYLYDGDWVEMTAQPVTAQNLTEGGTLETVEHTFYLSQYGPIVNLGGFDPLLDGWPNINGSVLTFVDANLENLRGLDQWVKMGQSGDMDEFKEALRAIGIPWVNTIAADRHGNAFYGDISVKPNVTIAQEDSCVRGLLQSAVTAFGLLTMDGSDPACALGQDEGTAPGVLGYDNLPKLDSLEYVANANDSYWLSNPRMLIEGFPSVVGEERIEQSRRTRATFTQAEQRLAGTDGLGDPGFNVDNIRQMSFQARNFTADLVLDAVLEVCGAIPEDPMAGVSMEQQACDVLGGWDRAHRTDSVGGHIFYEFWRVMRSTPDLWAIPFDPADPVNTPRDLDIANPAVADAVMAALTASVERLAQAGIPLDAPWGEVQFDERNGERIPIHGGSGDMMFSVISSSLVDGEGYANIRAGNSYMQAITWDESDCPDAYAILTYSQSTDPASPHFADATRLYGQSGWIDMPFCEADQEAQEIGSMRLFE